MMVKLSRPRLSLTGLPRRTQWTLVALIILFFYVLPMLNIPVITTPDSDFAGVLFTMASFSLAALGLNIVVGYAGLLDLG